MRIRSVKPEFWSHPVTGRQPGDVQAFLIGLLNHSDDHGYFFAEPTAVRSAIKPYDETTDACRVMLARAVAIGWCEIRTSPTHGAIGFIATFSEHQYVQKPRASQIQRHWEVALPDASGTPPVALPAVLDREVEEGIVLVEVGGKPPKPAAPPASLATAEGWWRHAQDRRAAVAGLINEMPPGGLGRWFSEAMGHVGGDELRLMAGYEAFLVDPFWRNEAKAKCAWSGWLKQWRQFVPSTAGPIAVAAKPQRGPIAAESVDWSTQQSGEIT